MGGGWADCAAVVLAVLLTTAHAEDRWSRPATPERRQGDWVPLTCANCRPVLDQGVQASNSLPSVLTPPPRVEEARLLPPPPPPDGLFQQAATGFLQAFTQQQPPRKSHQFLQETTGQASINRPQAQFLKSNGPEDSKLTQFVQEPSTDFTPPQLNLRQPQQLPFNQQQFNAEPPTNPYLQQPLYIGPQFLAAPFFPQPSIPQNIQPINPVQLQPQAPILPNVVPTNKQNFQVPPATRPVFTQQITAGPQNSAQQVITQTSAPQEQYSVNGTDAQKDEREGDEVQLLYVPVETLNQRARNLGRPNAFPSNQQDMSQQTVGTESNRFTSPGLSTRKPHLEDQENFNTQTHSSKHQYNAKQNFQFQQQLPPEDQEKFNTQTHSVRQQFNVKQPNEQFQQTEFANSENFKQQTQNNKQQYNFKQIDQYQQQAQQDQGNFNSQLNFQQNDQLQQQSPLGDIRDFQVQGQNTRQQNGFRLDDQYQAQRGQGSFNGQIINDNQQFSTLPTGDNFQQQQFSVNQNTQFQQLPVNQQPLTTVKEQPFINQPLQLGSQFSTEQSQLQQQMPTTQTQSQQQFDSPEFYQQTASPVPVPQTRVPETYTAQQTKKQRFRNPHKDALNVQKEQPYINEPITFEPQLSTNQAKIQQVLTQQSQQQFDQPAFQQQTELPVTPTRVPDDYTTQQIKKQRFRNQPHDATRNFQQVQSDQFNRKFPEDYQYPSTVGSTLAPVQSIDLAGQSKSARQGHQQSWLNHQNSNNQNSNQQEILDQRTHEIQSHSYQSDRHHASTLASPSSTLPPPQTTLAPNQPPLSVYMETTEDTKVNDVLRLLKNAKTIQVLDTVGPESPQVFVGPSNLKAPSGYIKFELPYLNAIESNRVERKVDKLPFFVAPLNFNPPPGYSKIPFPAPHIGSVVVSNVTVLNRALHEKPYEIEPVPVSTSERYLDQFTLPAQISPISPQLPSLINSLQDEIYSVSSTTALPPTTTEVPTTVYTTPQYRGRGSSRGSYRGSSSNPTSSTPTRRPQSRTRRPYDGRPYSRRQPVTTTTTVEPSSEASEQQHVTPQPEQVGFNSDAYIQNTPAPALRETAPKLQAGNSGTYYDESFVANNFNQQQFISQQQQTSGLGENQNVRQGVSLSDAQNREQFLQNSQRIQNNYPVEGVSHTTSLPTVAVSDAQQEEHTFKSQRTSSTRREPSRQHQRFRGRQRLTTTTTTESYEEPVQQYENQFSQNVDSSVNYQTIPSRHQSRNHNQQRLVENTHFEANIPDKYAIQTERADVGFQTTERHPSAQNEEHFIEQNNNRDHQTNTESQFSQPTLSQNSEPSDTAALQYQFQQAQAQFLQPNANLEQSNFNLTNQGNDFDYVPAPQQNSQAQYAVNQFKQVNTQRELVQEPRENFGQIGVDQPSRQVNQISGQQQNFFDQTTQQRQPDGQELIQSENQDGQIYLNQERARDHSSHDPQAHHLSTSGQFEQVSEVTTAQPVPEISVQTHRATSAQVDEEPQVQQYNQQRLVKYNRSQSRTPVTVDTSSTIEEQPGGSRRGHLQYQSNTEGSDSSTTEAGTTKASLVRVRGRVRSRQRGSTRNYQTTTEAPNYPTTYLTRQRNNQDKEEIQEYTPKKRVNYNSRPTYTSLRTPNVEKEVIPERSVTEENYASTERQSTSERYIDYTDVSTTTTEASTDKPSKRYQHILNRNKMRRTRPTNLPSTSKSSGTTRFLLPTTSPPLTRLPSTRGRIRKPVSTTTTTSTTEFPQASLRWNERESFAPSAGSNEILEPLYQTRDKTQSSFGFQRNPVASFRPQKTSPKPIAASSGDEDDYWNQAVTIQQSTSFDFKPDVSSVTPASFQENSEQARGTFSPIWNGQVELQDGNYYDVFNQQQVAKNINDQTPFSSDQQKVVYKDIKSRRPVGKENQYTEKTEEIQRPFLNEEEEILPTERVYPVYREIIKPEETIQEETSQQVVADPYGEEEKKTHEKHIEEPSEQPIKTVSQDEALDSEAGSEIKEGALKRKIFATNSGKKGGRRRGSWVRVRVRKTQPDMFETAESQNLASLSENAIQAVTKTSVEKGAWNPEPSTELPTTTTAETVSEPAETINFEEALKDMLKEFITPDEEVREEEETETSTNNQSSSETGNATTSEESKARENDHEVESGDSERQLEDKTILNKETLTVQEGTVKQDEEPVKTVTPEVTTEIFTQEPTTIFQTSENVDTTVEPEVTTTPNEQVYKNHHSRVLGTSTTTEISLETEICYRGRCVKTKKADGDSDLLTTE